MSDLNYWLALSLSPDVGNVLGRKLLSAFGDPENIFKMTIGELERIENIGASRAGSIVGFDQWDTVQKTIDLASENNIRIITFKDSSYPDGLKRLPDAPLVIYVNGDIANDDKYAVAVIGSRMSTEYGRRVAEKISHDLASAGLTVVSGMARGIDTASHKGALKAGGRTLAVLGSGIDVIYPPENRKLVDLIASSGAVISEFPFGTDPNRENFPRRNRMISALSFGVVVVEAAVDSGSLITVGYALEQGKEVFAVPGNITSRTSKGTNDLIKKGAKLIDSAQEIISELRYQIKGILREEHLLSRKPLPEMTEEEAALCKYLCNEPKHIDKIVREAKVPISKALSILLSLELNGVVKQTDGKRFYFN
ncbi:MAG TPA: DNA-protecting protein DprA [Nitrospirae bacterium]|nr:DNA-protecting protein DprA [Nitrospirota bacterium]